ncbi:hypothetical protein CEXT_414881 [Caerostris extrusa]|uniref:Uncharacterized protein n=1 Tax=Caerostris extrusa TaxID=172846 RepID=A0AAV4VP94_CAEEX|nr:hypothetical protein CEXT_414881 [Caerostris extrusa]
MFDVLPGHLADFVFPGHLTNFSDGLVRLKGTPISDAGNDRESYITSYRFSAIFGDWKTRRTDVIQPLTSSGLAQNGQYLSSFTLRESSII